MAHASYTDCACNRYQFWGDVFPFVRRYVRGVYAVLEHVVVVLVSCLLGRIAWRQIYATFAPSEIAKRQERWNDFARRNFGP